MKEFIKSHPLFSYIAVPILFAAIILALFYVLKPRRSIKNHFQKMFSLIICGLDTLENAALSLSREELKAFSKVLARVRASYEMLAGEELYEVEGVIANIERATAIVRALLTADKSGSSAVKYLSFVQRELQEIQSVLCGFSLTREKKDQPVFSTFESLNLKNNKKRAEQYLESL